MENSSNLFHNKKPISKKSEGILVSVAGHSKSALIPDLTCPDNNKRVNAMWNN